MAPKLRTLVDTTLKRFRMNGFSLISRRLHRKTSPPSFDSMLRSAAGPVKPDPHQDVAQAQAGFEFRALFRAGKVFGYREEAGGDFRGYSLKTLRQVNRINVLKGITRLLLTPTILPRKLRSNSSLLTRLIRETKGSRVFCDLV